jgi:hypothetical protein
MGITEKLIELIHAELSLCDAVDTPYVCTVYNSENREQIVQKVKEYVTKENLFISDAILAVEQDLSTTQQ